MLANFEMADQAVEFVMAKLDYSVVPEFHIDRFEFGIVIRRKGAGQENDPVNGGVKALNGRKLAVALSRSEPTIDRQVKAEIRYNIPDVR